MPKMLSICLIEKYLYTVLKLYTLILRHLFEKLYCGRNFDSVEKLMEHLVSLGPKFAYAQELLNPSL